jgi:Ran GTPase-activating protein (RanGAP) involved in mRNA processing and transport
MKSHGDFIATCQALRKNDPCLNKLNLAEYGSLFDCGHTPLAAPAWKCVQQVAQALEENTFVEDLTLSEDLCVESTLQFSHFMRTSPSLKQIEMRGKPHGESETIKASIFFDSISRSSVLVKLSLRDVLFGDHCPLEGFLSSTRTLVEFSYFQSYMALSYPAARAIGMGLTQNKSLEKLSWEMTQGSKFLEEVLFGLSNHISLKTLDLNIRLTESSSLALRSLLHCNRTLERLLLTHLGASERFETMVAVLAGLAENTGLKDVTFKSDSFEANATLATAWTNMLKRNTSITMLDLRDEDADCAVCSAVAEGLVTNSTLETLYLPVISNSNLQVFRGPVWEEMLESNRCLKKLCSKNYGISLAGFECLARGLSRNTSLESLDLSTYMTEASLIAIVDGLRTNKTLKCLGLYSTSALSQAGRAAIERLIGYNVLRELILAHFQESVGASILASDLSDNQSLERLDLQFAFVSGEGSETFRALCKSLRGNTTLRYLDVRNNGVRLDGVCVTALKLDTMSLETLYLCGNDVTSCGITALAQNLQRPCTLKNLGLCCCDDVGDTELLKLGEALTTNVLLEVLDVRANNITHNGASQFFELLPQMKGLKAVYGLVFGKNGDPPTGCTEAVEMALLDGLRENTKLREIFAADHEEATLGSYFPPGAAREIDFYLSLNRYGRILLRPPGGFEPPSGLWPRVLAKITAPRDMSLLFYFLQNTTKIVKGNAPANRKRKASDSPSLE